MTALEYKTGAGRRRQLRRPGKTVGNHQDRFPFYVSTRLRFFGQYLKTLPIPDAKPANSEVVASLAKESQILHTQRRARVEKFLQQVGLSPDKSTSRNPLEQPWPLPANEFTRRAPRPDLKHFNAARDETAALTSQIEYIEQEIDARVAALYGL